MNQLTTIKEQLVGTFQDMLGTVIQAIPLVIVGVILLVVAFVVAKGVERLLRITLERTKFDSLLSKIGLDSTIQKLGLRQSLSRFISRTAYYLLLILFVKTAADVIGLGAISDAIESFFRYLPNLISALLLVLIGTSVSQFVGKAVTRAAENSGIEFASSLGGVASGMILFVIGIMAVAQLKIDTDMVRLVTSGALAALALAFGLSFGLGTREITRNMIAGFYARRVFNAGDEMEIRGQRGTLKAITPTQTILSADGQTVAFSNSVFLDEVVRS